MMQENKKIVETEKYWPPELIAQILSWTPAKSLVRFKCVSKLWRATIEERFLVRMHSTHLRSCVLCKKQRSAENREKEVFDACSVVDGMILERSHPGNAYRIRNPLTKQVLVLPIPFEQHLHMTMFYSVATKKYKLLYIYKKEGTRSGGCKFLTLDIDLYWRNVEVRGLQEGISEKMNGMRVNDMFFLLKEDSRQIVCFDMKSEHSSIVEIPQDCIISGVRSISPVCCNNNFAINKVNHNAVRGEWKLDIWVLEDYKKNKWGQSKISVPLPFMTKYLPEATHITVVRLMDQWLIFTVNYGQQLVVCNTLDMNAKPSIKNSSPQQRIQCNFRPSVSHLQVMKAEEKQEESTSGYEILNLPMS